MLRGIRLLVVLALVATVILVGLAIGRAQMISVGSLAKRAPERTALMEQRAREAAARGRRYRVDQRWVPYGRISPLLRRAVLIAEDDAFYAHGGLDWNEIEKSARENWKKRKIVRGGSTITQQLAKNLYLGDHRTPLRKMSELFVALRLERELSKRRIFELYLNLIEWGDGVYGAEAAARRHFGTSAAGLNARQAVLLAAIIINPRRYSANHPDRRIERRVKLIAQRMRRRGFLDEEQYAMAIGAPPPERGFFDWLFGRDSRPDTVPWVEEAPPPAPDTLPHQDSTQTPSAPDTAAVR